MSRGRILRRLLGFLRPLWGWMALSIAMRVLNQLAGIALLLIAVWGVAQAHLGELETGTWIGGLVLAGFVKGLCRYLEQLSGHYVAFHLLALLRHRFYAAVEPLAPAGLSAMRSGEAVARVIGDVDRIEPFYAHTVAPVVSAVVVPAAVLTALGASSPRLAAALLPFLLVQGIVLPWWNDRAGRRSSEAVRRASGEVNAHLTDSFQGLREVVAFGYGERRREELRQRGRGLVRAQDRLGRIAAATNGVSEALVLLGTTLVFALSLGLLATGELGLVGVLSATVLALLSFTPLLGLPAAVDDLNQALSAAGRLFELMDRRPPIRERAGAASTASPGKPLEPSIRFADVRFGYRDGEELFSGLSFEVPAGRKVALVGPSGAGKSSVVQLLVRFWDPWDGRVLVGGHDVRDLAVDDLRRHIAVVDQRTFIFNGTIGDNVRLGDPEADDERVAAALTDAQLADFVAALPAGLETEVGEMGSQLSGGQRQRIAIARALLVNAPVLVLDEPTANLDPGTEQRLRRALDRLTAGRTTLVIAHRLATVVDADEILVLDKGRIVERGRHVELLASGGLYSRLFARQCDEIEGP